MDRSKVEEIVKKVVAENLGAPMDKIQSTSHIQEDLGADSLDVVELVMALEEEFEMEITGKQPRPKGRGFSCVQTTLD